MKAEVVNDEDVGSGSWLIDIVERASTIAERLGDGFITNETGTSEAKVDARLEEWCHNVASGDWEQFRRYLSWDGYDLETIRPALGRVRFREGAAFPGWADTLRDARALTSSMQRRGDDAPLPRPERFLQAEHPLPFEGILAPFVLVARQKLATQIGDGYGLLSSEAHGSLERSLLASLSVAAAEALQIEFTIQRAQAAPSLDRLVAAARNPDDRTLYLEFVQYMLDGGLFALFGEYPVLARQLAETTDLWVEAAAELLARLREDLDEIGRTFGDEDDPGEVVKLHASLSDPHRGRRTVMALTFASGLKLIYKPKDPGTEEMYVQLLQWLNDRGAPLPFKLLKVLNRSSYGWVEFVEHLPCQDQAEATRYYRRAGMLLCLLYVLEVTDGHRENLIASGEHPVLIDMETLLQHRGVKDEDDQGRRAVTLALDQLERSVLRIGLLPMWQLPSDQSFAFDVSGLGSGHGNAPFQALMWDAVNTDRMTRAYQPTTMERRQNIPRLGDDPLRLTDYADELVDGFQQMYRFLQNQRDGLLAPGSPLHKLGDQQVRYLFRGTRIYFGIRRKLADPRYLRDGADWSIGLEMLARAALPLTASDRAAGRRSTFWPVFAAERQAMVQGDIPYFTAAPDSMHLVLPHGVLENCFTGPSLDIAMRRLQTLSDEDLELQVGFIRGALYTHLAHDSLVTTSAGAASLASEPGQASLLDRAALVAEASAIAEQIQEHAVRHADGSASWIAPHLLPQAKRYQLLPVGYDLYDGATGIGLFLAALERVTGGAGYRDMALSAVQPLRRALREYGDILARDFGIGGASGLGSMAYALLTMSRLLDDLALLDDARSLASLIRRDHVEADTALDVISGASGALLCLLSLYEATGDGQILDTAVVCGRHLVKTQVETGRDGCAWRNSQGICLTGFSHGAAGMAYALLRLHSATEAIDFRQAAEQAIAYETSVFAPDVGNWPDFREEQPGYMTSWCHGAPGIGLARLGGLPVLDTPGIRGDIEVALETTQRFGVRGPDYPCCGTMGRVDFLLTASVDLGRPALADAARAQAAEVVSQARQRGSYALHPLLPEGLRAPAFFQGTSGIGYELLRLAYPEVLPSVLLWR